MMHKKRVNSLVVLTFLLSAFTWYLYSNWEKFLEIKLVNPLLLIPAVLFIMINIFCQGKLLDLTIEPHGIKLRKLEIFGLSTLTRLGNYVSTGYLGTALRAFYLKKTYKLSYTKFSSSFLLSNVLQLIYSGFLALLVYALQTGSVTDSKPIIIIVFSLLFFLGVLFMPVRYPRIFIGGLIRRRRIKVLEQLSLALSEYNKVRSHPKLLIRMFFWLVVAIFASSFLLYLIYNSLGFSAPFLSILFISILGGWAIIFSVTPANIGISEGFFVVGAGLVDISIPATIAAAVMLRIIVFVTISLLSLFFAPKLLNISIHKIQNLEPKIR